MSAPPQKQPSISTLVLGAIAFNIFGVLIVACFFGMMLGSICYPYTVGLYVVFPYLTYTLALARLELKDGAHCQSFSRNFRPLVWCRLYFQMRIQTPIPEELVRADCQPNAQFVIAAFPHGVFADYRAPMDGILHRALPNTADKCRTLAASVLFRLPLVREIGLWTGCVDARRSVANALLDRGRSVLVVPGGEAEQIRTTRGREIVYLRKRKGFIRLAMRHRVPIVPLYVFGASDYYRTSHALYRPREWLQKKAGVCIPLAVGYFGSSFCPMPVKTTLCFGKPMLLECVKAGAPTVQEVDSAHEKFCAALHQLFDEHKQALGYGERSLEMV
jgi:1-acyl-sn-glycerol-3-phosphate acyltransferase